jgi:DNA-binding XRE family transcriptional regulator
MSTNDTTPPAGAAPHPDHAEYPDHVNERVRAELKRRRRALGLTPYSMAIPKRLSAQTIRNVESGAHSPSLTTLALMCGRLQTNVEALGNR